MTLERVAGNEDIFTGQKTCAEGSNTNLNDTAGSAITGYDDKTCAGVSRKLKLMDQDKRRKVNASSIFYLLLY